MARYPYWVSALRSLGWGFLVMQLVYLEERSIFPGLSQVLWSAGLVTPLPVTLASMVATTREVAVLLGGLIGLMLAELGALGLASLTPGAAPLVGWTAGWAGVGTVALPLLARPPKPGTSGRWQVAATLGLAVVGLVLAALQYRAGFGHALPLLAGSGQAEIYAFACLHLGNALVGATIGGYVAAWLAQQRVGARQPEVR